MPKGYWRDSEATSKVYACNNDVCNGSNGVVVAEATAPYCAKGNYGPKCELCSNPEQYFSNPDGRCLDCPPLSRFAILSGIIVGLGVIILAAHFWDTHSVLPSDKIVHYIYVIANFNLQAKLKIIISFYQVVNTLPSVYGVRLDKRLWEWAGFLRIINFKLTDLLIPGNCLGSMKDRLIVGAVWPYFVIIAAILGIFVHALVAMGIVGIKENVNILFNRTLYVTILILYLVLPSVSNSIFEAIKCEAFRNDEDQGVNSYLVADWSIKCESSNAEYSSLKKIFWVLFCFWPILVPCVFSVLLKRIQYKVKANKTSTLSEACRFLWKDYEEHVIFWDIIDTLRKVFLTGFIMFVDAEKGSSRVLRLIVATVVSSVYMSILAYARPYKRTDNFHLALISSILLICFFSLGIVIQLCDDDEDLCNRTIGFNFTSLKATVVALILTASMLFVTIISLVIVTINTKNAPTIRLAKTGYEPNLELPKHIDYHAFLSHVWHTGQGKTHAIVRKLQLHVPGIRVWLDVDDLENIGMLEKSVANCVVVVIFYSKGYFESRNCRRELYAAVEQNKPILVLYDGQDGTVEEMKERCRKYCTDTMTPAAVLERFSTAEHILWLSAKYYSTESMKLVSKHIFKLLPYFQRQQTVLNKGLLLAGTLESVNLSSKLDILVCKDNIGCMEVAEEVVALAKVDSSNLIFPRIIEFDTVLDNDLTAEVPETRKILLFYINEDAFKCPDNMLIAIKYAMAVGIRIVMVHEQNPKKGGCDFGQIMQSTPTDLVVNGLYHDLAVPLYEHHVYRKISLRQVLLAMGAESKIHK